MSMDAEDYIARYGAHLTESEKRYIRAFGAPQVHEEGARAPTTPSLRIQSEFSAELAREELQRAQDQLDEEEAAEWDELG